MASEITYAEVKFKNESTSLNTKPEPPAAPKEKTNLHKSNSGFSKILLPSLLILLLLLTISFFIAFIVFFQKYSWLLKEKKDMRELTHTALECMKESLTMEAMNWTESKKKCLEMKAHLLVIDTKEEQDFITQKVNTENAYYVGLSDPEGKRAWQWVDQTPYNESATFWHPGEPNDPAERCVILNKHAPKSWGWNDVPCQDRQMSICKMMKIYL